MPEPKRSDPILDEIRIVRDKMHEQYRGDIAALVRDLREEQDRSGRAVVSYPSKPPRKPKEGAA